MMPLQTRSVYVRMMPVQTICIEDSAQVCCHGWREPWSVLKGGRPVHKGISLHALARSCGPLSCTWFHPPDDADNPICLCLLWTSRNIHKCLSHDHGREKWCILPPPQKCTFPPQSIFYPLFLNEDDRIRAKRHSKLHYFDDIQLCLRQFCFNLNICNVMTIFFKFWPKKIRKTGITLQILRFKQNCLRQSWISSKSIMQTIFQNSAIFIEKKWVENQL